MLHGQELFTFACGESRQIPASYVEFAERLVLTEYSHLHVRTLLPTFLIEISAEMSVHVTSVSAHFVRKSMQATSTGLFDSRDPG